MEELDMKDKRLLYWLDRDARMTKKQLGKKIHLSPQGVSYRLQRLQDENIIEDFVTFVNTPALGYTHYKVFIHLHDTTLEDEETIRSTLVEHPHIRWVVDTGGTYDMSFSVLARTPRSFREIYQDIETEFGRSITKKNVAVNVKSPGFTRSYFLGKDISERLPYGDSHGTVEIDETDRVVLKDVSTDARKNIVDIANSTDTTVDIVKYRLRKLRDSGVIQGHTIRLNRNALGLQYYSVFLHMHDFTEETEQQVLSFAKNNPNILFVVHTIGNHDLQLEIEVPGYETLQSNLNEFRRAFSDHINSFDTLRVLDEYKYDFYPFSV